MSEMWHRINAILHSYRAFLIILTMTAIVWVLISLSETKQYQANIKIDYTGFDEAQYVVVQADTSINLNFNLNGYQAIGKLLGNKTLAATVNVSSAKGLHKSLSLRSVLDTISAQIGFSPKAAIVGAKDSLSIVLKPLNSRVFKPDISALDLSFSDQFGLGGDPIVTPEHVVLYGSETSLEKITKLEVEPTSFVQISESASYKVKLQPIWDKYKDIRPSVEEVSVFIPVEPYTEKDFTLPVSVSGIDSSINVRLYPSTVTVKAWVPQRLYSEIKNDSFEAEVDYTDIAANANKLHVRLSSFPANSRIKSVTPPEIQYVVIK